MYLKYADLVDQNQFGKKNLPYFLDQIISRVFKINNMDGYVNVSY